MAQVKLDVTVDSKQLSEFQGKLKELGASATETGDRADKGLSFKGMIAGGAIIGLANKAVGVLSGSIGGAIQRVDTLNNANRAFQNMGFSAQQTDGVMNKLQGAIQGLPTPMNEAVSATQLLAASTGKAGKSADIYKSLNDSILGFGGTTEQVNEAVTQLSQAFSNGKVDGQTWNSMINAGMGPSLNALAKTMGMTTGEMKAGLSSGKISVEKFQDSLINLDKNGGGGMKSLSKIAKDSTAGIGTSMQNIKTAIVRGLANVIQPLAKPMAQALNAMIPMIDNVGKKIAAMMPGIIINVMKAIGVVQKVVTVIQNLSPIIAPLAVVIGTAITAFMAVQKTIAVFMAVKKAIAAVNVVLAANPVGLVIAAVAALVAGFIYLWKTNEGFRNFFITAWNAIQQVAVTVWNAIKTAAMAVFNFLKPAITALITFWTIEFNIIKAVVTVIFNVIKTVVLGVFTAIKAIVTGFVAFWTAVWSGVTQVATAVWNGITAVFTTVFNVIIAIVRGALAIILGIWFLQFNIIKNVVVTVFNAIAGFLAPILATIGKVISAAVRVISAGWKAGWNAVKSVAQAVWNVIRSVVTTYINAVRAVITRVMNVIRSFFTAAWNALKRPVTSAWNAIKGAVTSGINTVKSVVQSGLNRVKSIFTSIWQSLSGIISSAWGAIKGAVTTITSGITSAFESVVGKMSDIGHRIVQGIAGGLRAAWGSVTSAISRLVGQIPAKIRKLLGIHSPSRVTKKLGRFTAEGLAVGIADGSKASKKEAAKLATGTTKAMKRAMSKYKAGKISPGDYVQELKDLKKYGTSTKATTKRINESIAKVNKKAASANRKTYNQMNNVDNKRKAGKGYTNDYSYLDQLKKIKKSSKATGATYDSLNKKIATVQGSIKSQVIKAQDATAAASKKYVTTVKKIDDQLLIDIQAATDAYNEKLAELKNSIYSQIGLFDAVAKKAVSKSTLAKNLNDQVNQMTQWQANVAKIAKKVPAALTDELRTMGVGSSAEIKAMTQMTDRELQQYVALWNQKHNLANSEADIEIIPDKNTLNTNIQNMQDAATRAIIDAGVTLNKDMNDIGAKFKNLGSFKSSGSNLGKNTVQGLINGLADKKKRAKLEKSVSDLAASIEKSIRNKLRIHSPSRVMAQLGGFVGAGLTNGISDQIRTVQRASQKMAEAVINPVGNIKVNPKIQGLFDNTSVEKALGISGKLNASSNVNNYYNNVTHQSQTNTAGQEALSYLKAIADKSTTIDGSSVGKALAPYQSVANANRNGLSGRGIAIGNNI